MANMLYNGVELPALPDYDTAAYPYVHIVYIKTTGVYRLYAYNKPLEADNTRIYFVVGTTNKDCDLDKSTEAWGSWTNPYTTTVVTYTEFSVATLVWSNHDVTKTDGSVYLAGSDPVDPNAPAEPTYDKTAFLSGLAMGLCGKGDPTFTGGGASGNYLYNGVELPDINTVWTDKEMYPYAAVIDMNAMTSGAFSYGCYLFSSHLIEVDSDEEGQLFGSSTAIDVVIYAVDGSNWLYQISGNDIFGVYGDWLVWSNHDILNADSTVYLAASDPVPADDTTDTIPAVFTKGYLTGAELRRKRVIPASSGANGDGFALYNGVKLPNIDSVLAEDENYQYAVIASVSGASYLITSQIQMSYVIVNDTPTLYGSGLVAFIYDPEGLLGEGNITEWTEPFLLGSQVELPGFPLIWCNVDVVNGYDNTTYLAASNPIPLDGYNVIEWDGNTEGLESVADTWYKFSDVVLSKDELVGGLYSYSDGSNSEFGLLTDDLLITIPGIIGIVGELTLVVTQENATVDGTDGSEYVFPTKGLYGQPFATLIAYKAT